MLAGWFRFVAGLAATILILAVAAVASASTAPNEKDARLAGAYRLERGGWTYVHLQGTPGQIGFQHGYLLASEIADFSHVIRVETKHSTNRDWRFFREAGRTILWPHIDAEYQQELKGIAAGVKARGVQLDLWDIVAANGWMELSEYYVPWLDRKPHAANVSAKFDPKAPGNCSAFIATGSYTKDGKVVIAHNNWSSYAEDSRWVIVFDIQPAHGHRILMDGAPGLIDSADDFGINDAGIMVTETTISQFVGWNSKGIPRICARAEGDAICELD